MDPSGSRAVWDCVVSAWPLGCPRDAAPLERGALHADVYCREIKALRVRQPRRRVVVQSSLPRRISRVEG